MSNYSLGLLCECCGARRSDGSRRLCAQCYEAMGGIEAATSPWWKEPDGVLARFAAMPPLCAKLLFD